MTNLDYVIFIIVGSLFLVLGLGALFWGYREEKGYFNTLSTRNTDLREFMSHWPPRPQPGALKLGGWLAIAIGLVIGLIGVIYLLLART